MPNIFFLLYVFQIVWLNHDELHQILQLQAIQMCLYRSGEQFPVSAHHQFLTEYRSNDIEGHLLEYYHANQALDEPPYPQAY